MNFGAMLIAIFWEINPLQLVYTNAINPHSRINLLSMSPHTG
jgi:hypothetical protein